MEIIVMCLLLSLPITTYPGFLITLPVEAVSLGSEGDSQDQETRV